MKGSFSRRSLGNVVGPWFLFDANFELTPLEPGPAASSWRGLQWRPRPAGGTLRGRLMPRFRTISNSLLACKPVTMKHSDATEDVIMIKRPSFPRPCSFLAVAHMPSRGEGVPHDRERGRCTAALQHSRRSGHGADRGSAPFAIVRNAVATAGYVSHRKERNE